MEIRRLALKKLDDYVVDESTILLIASWFLEHNGQIVINSQRIDYGVIPIDILNNFALLIWYSSSLTIDEKQKALHIMYGDSNTDLVQRTKKTCTFCLPDSELKASLWKDLSDVNTKEPLFWYQAKLNSFKAILPHQHLKYSYLDQIYLMLPIVGRSMERQKCLEFLRQMNPTYLATEEDLAKITELSNIAENDSDQYPSYYRAWLGDRQDYIKIQMRIRETANAYESEGG